MNDVIFNAIVKQICETYINLFIIAVNNQIDLRSLAMEIDEKANDYFNSDAESFYPKGFKGVLFISAIAKAMGLSLFDVMYYGEEEKKLVVEKILDVMSSISFDANDLIIEEPGQTSFEGIYSFENESGREKCYVIRFVRTELDEAGYSYSIEVFLAEDGKRQGVYTDYMYDSAEIWSETEGVVADYIESTITSIEEQKQADIEESDSMTESRDDETEGVLEKTTKLVGYGKVIGNISIVPRKGKLSEELRRKTKMCYVKIKTKYIQVAYDELHGIGYVDEISFNKYREVLSRWVEFIPAEVLLKKDRKPMAIQPKPTIITQPHVTKEKCKKCKELTEIFKNGLCWDCYKDEMDAMFAK